MGYGFERWRKHSRSRYFGPLICSYIVKHDIIGETILLATHYSSEICLALYSEWSSYWRTLPVLLTRLRVLLAIVRWAFIFAGRCITLGSISFLLFWFALFLVFSPSSWFYRFIWFRVGGPIGEDMRIHSKKKGTERVLNKCPLGRTLTHHELSKGVPRTQNPVGDPNQVPNVPIEYLKIVPTLGQSKIEPFRHPFS